MATPSTLRLYMAFQRALRRSCKELHYDAVQLHNGKVMLQSMFRTASVATAADAPRMLALLENAPKDAQVQRLFHAWLTGTTFAHGKGLKPPKTSKERVQRLLKAKHDCAIAANSYFRFVYQQTGLLLGNGFNEPFRNDNR